MKRTRSHFAHTYGAALSEYLHEGSGLKIASKLGETAVTNALRIPSIASIHNELLVRELSSVHVGTKLGPLIRKGGRFFAEVIRTVEKRRREDKDASSSREKPPMLLAARTKELLISRKELKQEIRNRQSTEKALVKSERHFNQSLGESARLQKQLRFLSHQLLFAQEDERKRISRELHDQIAASLTGINLELSALEKVAAASNNKALKERIEAAQDLVLSSVESVHRFAADLRPTLLDHLGLIPALLSFTRALSKRTGVRISLTVAAAVENLDNMRRTVLYRVIQEALNNVANHADALDAVVDLRQIEDAIVLAVHDNGKSFKVARIFHPKNKRLGLLGMRERIEMIGGRFSVESIPNKGTTIHATIPVKSNETRIQR